MTQKPSKLALTSLILAVGAYVAYFALRISAIFFIKSGTLPKILSSLYTVIAISFIMAVFAVVIGHYVRRKKNRDISPSSSGVSLAGLILGYIFMAYSLFAIGVGIWFSHAMKNFD